MAVFHDEFFPTPAPIIAQMLAKIDREARYYLEPSAGKGDMAQAILSSERYHNRHVDCIEIVPDLVTLLHGKGFPVVGYDWLTYDGVSYYDAIVMNPPFANGDVHLLKAWDFLHAGEIVCLLNSETLRNPYTLARQRLATIIAEHGEVEELGACFTTAERPTDVEVSLVYLKKASEDDRIELWANTTAEREVNEEGTADPQWVAIRDTLGNMEHYYNMANHHMFTAFQHLRKAALYMEANASGYGYRHDYDKIVHLAFGNITHARAEFGRQHRKDAWVRVFQLMDFHQWLDKKQTDQFLRDIEREASIPFTTANIKGTLENIWMQRQKLFEISVANVFDELTRYYKGNHAHTEGWASNESYKVNQKLVLPYGCEFDHKYCKDFKLRWDNHVDIYNDLDRILCMLDGTSFKECWTIGKALEIRFCQLGTHVPAQFDNQVESQYFHIRFFKKGTVHLTFKDKHLWQEFNVTAAKGKRWLGMQTHGCTEDQTAQEPAPTHAPAPRAPLALPSPATDSLRLFA